MLARLRGSGYLARQLCAALLMFALIVQGMGFAFAVGRLGAGLPSDISSSIFELCRHNNGPAQSGDEPNIPVTDQHCIFCLAGGNLALAPSTPAETFAVVFFTVVPRQFTVWRLPAGPVNASAQPRGPPLAV